MVIGCADNRDVRKVLIRATNWLGDAVMTTPALMAVRNAFPRARITLLANPLVAALFSPHPAVDDVLVYDGKGEHAGIGGRLRVAGMLRPRRFDLAILLQNAFDAALITFLARIPRRIGYATDGRRLLLTGRCPVSERVRKLHHVEYYLAMLEHFGIVAGDRNLVLSVTRDETSAVEARLASAGIGGSDLLIGINPGAAYGSAKRWYPDRFARVGEELGDRWGARIVITGGPGEAAIAGEIEQALGGRAVNLAGKTSVRELMALISRCNFFVTNDSGPMHIAAAFQVPLVAIFGSTDDTTTSPWSPSAKIVRSPVDCAPCLKRECPTDHRCMTGVTAAAVVAQALAMSPSSPQDGTVRP